MEIKAPVRTPTRTAPATLPDVSPRYDPDRDHCPAQRTRTVRRIRRTIEAP